MSRSVRFTNIPKLIVVKSLLEKKSEIKRNGDVSPRSFQRIVILFILHNPKLP